jgi:hypothetical protein
MMLRRVQVELDFEKLARFRPPFLVTLYISTVRAIQVTCLFTSMLLVLRYFNVTVNVDIGWLALTIFLTHQAIFYRHLWIEQRYVLETFFARLGEFLVMIIALRLVLLAFGEVSPLLTLNFVYYGFFMGATWFAATAFLHQFFNLYLQAYEVSEEEGGVPALGDSYHLSYDHSQAYQEMKTNFHYFAGIQIAVAIAGVSLIKQVNNNPAEDWVVPLIILLSGIFLLLGVPILAWARMRYIRTLWQLDKMKEPAHLIDRWVYYLGGLILLVIIVTLGVTSLGGVFTLPLPNNARDQGAFAIFYPPTPIPQSPPPTLDLSKISKQDPGLNLAWLGIVFQALALLVAAAFVVIILWYAFSRLVQTGWVGPQWRKFKAGQIWQGLRMFFRNLFGGNRPRDPFEREEGEGRGKFDPFGWLQRDRLPNDARGQVRFYYRQMAQRAQRAGLPRRTGQTPKEYAGYLAPNLEAEQDQASLDSLTGLYQEARFSPHPVDESQVETAKESSQGLVAFFRQRSRKARIKPHE